MPTKYWEQFLAWSEGSLVFWRDLDSEDDDFSVQFLEILNALARSTHHGLSLSHVTTHLTKIGFGVELCTSGPIKTVQPNKITLII